MNWEEHIHSDPAGGLVRLLHPIRSIELKRSLQSAATRDAQAYGRSAARSSTCLFPTDVL